jgi:hypothetical protein
MVMIAQPTGTGPIESVRTLLAGAIDYAGLFPPAGLSMPEAVINYATYKNSNYNWMLGRFIVTDVRLAEFYENAVDFISRDASSAWQVSVVAGDDVDETLRVVDDYNSQHSPGTVCDALEIRASTPEQIESVTLNLPQGVTAYFELPLDDSLPDLVAAIALSGHRAKIRTGGLTPDAFPRTDDIVRFVRTCIAANVMFKATAGLHHPIRCFRPLTYENNSPEGTMHGFLNLFLMTGFAREGYRPSFLVDVMEEEFEEVFRFDEQAVLWRDEFALSLRQIEGLRNHGIQSFGSCSFDEPVSDLQKLGVL